MCLILFAIDAHPRYRLVVAANRDEYHGRPTRPAGFWDDKPHVLAGRDEQAGGTWMGINRYGDFAAVTNFRSGSAPRGDLRSRGDLCVTFLDANSGARAAATDVAGELEHYNGFSLLLADPAQMQFVSNRGSGALAAVPAGVHGLSNDTLNEPWPKVRKGRARLNALLGADVLDPESLLELLADDSPAPPEELPDTGVGQPLEQRLSSLFIPGEHYGTRSSTVVLVDEDDHVDFIERSFDNRGRITGQVHERFAIAARGA